MAHIRSLVKEEITDSAVLFNTLARIASLLRETKVGTTRHHSTDSACTLAHQTSSENTVQNFTQVLKQKRVDYTSEEISRPQPLTLLEIIPWLPPAGTVGAVDPLTLATGEVRDHCSIQVSSFSQNLSVLVFSQRVFTQLLRKWNKIGVELLRRGVVVEIARADAPVVDGEPVLVGAFGVEKRGTPLPPATQVLRLIVNAIPSNKQQTAIKGDIEKMPVEASGFTLRWKPMRSSSGRLMTFKVVPTCSRYRPHGAGG